MLRIHGSDDCLHFRRMAKDPGQGNSCFGDLLPVGNLRQDCIQFREVRIVDKCALEESELQGRPCLDGDISEPPMTEVTGFLMRLLPQAALYSRTWSSDGQPVSSAQNPYGYSLPQKRYPLAGLPVFTPPFLPLPLPTVS